MGDDKFIWIKNSKSKEDILKSLEGKSLEEKFTIALKNRYLPIMHDCVVNKRMNTKNFTIGKVGGYPISDEEYYLCIKNEENRKSPVFIISKEIYNFLKYTIRINNINETH